LLRSRAVCPRAAVSVARTSLARSSRARHRYVMVDVLAPATSKAPVRVHLMAIAPVDYRVVGIGRLAKADPPRL
jgi:hypothetical protein